MKSTSLALPAYFLLQDLDLFLTPELKIFISWYDYMLEMENILAEKCESFAILSFDFWVGLWSQKTHCFHWQTQILEHNHINVIKCEIMEIVLILQTLKWWMSFLLFGNIAWLFFLLGCSCQQKLFYHML